MKIIGATFAEHGQARRALNRIRVEIALPNEPQIVRAEAAGVAVSLLGVRAPDNVVERVRAIIECAGGEVESEVPETAIE